jgi:hypothetical protein
MLFAIAPGVRTALFLKRHLSVTLASTAVLISELPGIAAAIALCISVSLPLGSIFFAIALSISVATLLGSIFFAISISTAAGIALFFALAPLPVALGIFAAIAASIAFILSALATSVFKLVA